MLNQVCNAFCLLNEQLNTLEWRIRNKWFNLKNDWTLVDNRTIEEHFQFMLENLRSHTGRLLGTKQRLLTLHVSDLVHVFRAVKSTTPQWTSALYSRSEGTERETRKLLLPYIVTDHLL